MCWICGWFACRSLHSSTNISVGDSFVLCMNAVEGGAGRELRTGVLKLRARDAELTPETLFRVHWMMATAHPAVCCTLSGDNLSTIQSDVFLAGQGACLLTCRMRYCLVCAGCTCARSQPLGDKVQCLLSQAHQMYSR